MFTVPILPLAVLVEIGKFHHPPYPNQRVGFLGGALGECSGDQQQRPTEHVNHFHFGTRKVIRWQEYTPHDPSGPYRTGDDMKRILLWLCAVLICFSCSNAQEKNASTKNAPHVSPQDQKFVDTEKALWEAWKTKDRKPYEDLLSDKFFEVDVTGT